MSWHFVTMSDKCCKCLQLKYPHTKAMLQSTKPILQCNNIAEEGSDANLIATDCICQCIEWSWSFEMWTIPLSFCLMARVGDLHNPVDIVNTRTANSECWTEYLYFFALVCFGLNEDNSDISENIVKTGQQKIKHFLNFQFKFN